MAGTQCDAGRTKSAGFLGDADRKRLRIRRRIRAHLPRLANHRSVARGVGAGRGMEGKTRAESRTLAGQARSVTALICAESPGSATVRWKKSGGSDGCI